MKLIRFGEPGKEKPGIILDYKAYDLSMYVKDFNEDFFELNGLQEVEKIIAANKNTLKELPENSRLGSPVARPSKIVCIGLNYSDHAKETGATTPAEPVIFLKSTTAIVGPYDNVMTPLQSEKTDWEVELAVVIGTKASYVEEADAMDYVAGYCLHNDISERAFQLERGGTWDKGKGCDTFAPIGPALVTKDEIADVHNLKLWLKVNGDTM
jgi:2-keto-4-pentenoate hydratase/2-oxohepta-3-ene-1,7-dioic acid hydratase in catechol pathway